MQIDEDEDDCSMAQLQVAVSKLMKAKVWQLPGLLTRLVMCHLPARAEYFSCALVCAHALGLLCLLMKSHMLPCPPCLWYDTRRTLLWFIYDTTQLNLCI
jgi:hypothetical protein